MNIVYVYSDSQSEWNSSEWRCAVPARAINASGRHAAMLLNINSFNALSAESHAACQVADIIIVQRNIFGPTFAAMLHWQARGKPVAIDFDDAYNLMPATVTSYPFWMQGRLKVKDAAGKDTELNVDPPPMTQFRWGLRLAQGATVSARQLEEDWREVARVRYLPNYIELSRYQKHAVPPAHKGILIGWGGSLSHLQSFTGSGVVTAIKRICRARPDVKLMICGDMRVFEKVPLPAAQKIFQPYVPADRWPDTLARFDIGLAPLEGAYDGRRSWIKVLEYMAMQIPWVASRGPAYAELAAFGALVENTPAAWEAALMDAIDHLEERRAQAAGAAYDFACAQDVEKNVDKIVAVYQELMAR